VIGDRWFESISLQRRVGSACRSPSATSRITTCTASGASSSKTSPAKPTFSNKTVAWPCHGDPAFTYCDVERAVARRIAATVLIERYRAAHADEIEGHELRQLDRLKAKYEGVAR
jgi:hypothetical protein